MRWTLMLCVMTTLGYAADWPRFRGPNGSGVAETAGLPDELSIRKNLLWRVDVPMGRSSPIVIKDRIYVTALEGERLVLLALEAKDGKTAWRREIVRDHTNKIFAGNDTATPTPTSDGENIYAFFADLGLVSFDPKGNERWRLKLGPFDSFYGVSSSPVVHGNTVIVVCDQRSGSFVTAADTQTGRVRWRTERKHTRTEAYTTPAIYAPDGGKPRLIITGSSRVDAYDLETGEDVWWAGKQGVYPIGSPVIFKDMVISVSEGSDTPEFPPFDSFLTRLDTNKDGRLSPEEWAKDAMFKDHFGWLDTNHDGFISRDEFEQKVKESLTPDHGVTASRMDRKGDGMASNPVWRYKKSYSNLITPLLYRDILYLVKDGGIVTTLNPATGNVLKTGRAKDAMDEYFASPVAGDGKVFLLSQSGKATVLKAGAEWDVLSVSDIGEPAKATPAIADGRVYVRTDKALYAFGAR